MDFKIGDEIVEPGTEDNNKNKKLSLIIIIIASLLIGLTVFLVSNAIFGQKKTPTESTETKLELENETVKELYSYVTYGVKGERNDKFIREQNVKLENFSNYEKFYYALQFAESEDFSHTGQVNDQKQKVYNISSARIKTYMQRFFGNKVTYSTSSVITYPFNFKLDDKNVATISYAVERSGFDAVFIRNEDKTPSTSLIKPYYTELVKASKYSDGSIKLTEKIIYTDLIPQNNLYEIRIYKDFQKTMLLETKTNLTKEQIDSKLLSMEEYVENAATITYTFKAGRTGYYFYSSSISN